MQTNCLIALVTFIISVNIATAQKIEVEVPETYELSNIILALTKYGQTDPYEVQQPDPYYNELKAFFEPVKNHPLLDSVNYSREKWDLYLSFRTDAYAFVFDENGLLKRNLPFYANFRNNKPLKPFDDQLSLINDFIKESNFREFYKKHHSLYQKIIDNYLAYHFVEASQNFLNDFAPNSQIDNQGSTYKIVLSPLVGRMNCHRNISKGIAADFPSISGKFISGTGFNNQAERLTDNHMLFTELDHGYVNPISDIFKNEINNNFKYEYWDKKSGYKGIDCFNEYMTWAVYDLFVKKMAPESADSICANWHYQNASRGFIASDLFTEKLIDLYSKTKNCKLIDLYPEMLKWTASIQSSITQPKLVDIDPKQNITKDGVVRLTFSEPMNTKKAFGIRVWEVKDGEGTNNSTIITLDKKKNKVKWSKDGKSVSFVIEKPYDNFQMQFNWWKIKDKLVSQKKIMLEPRCIINGI